MSTLIEIHNLNKKYGKKQVLKDVNLTLNGGQIVGLLGPNGSGKTTLIKVLNGLLKDFQGQISIDQQPIGIHSKKIISYLPDEPYFENWMTTSDALNLFVDMYDDFDLNKALALMERMDIEKKIKIKELSKGMKEKFQLILVMSRKAKIYILDEPLGGIDPVARELILDIILNNYADDALVLLSTHLIADIEKIFDEVIFIKNGEIVLHENSEDLRSQRHASINDIFKEEFKC
ncbi:ABC transporter ATP-binding protein [Allocoprobacillus halotolerans]|uniref:ABC transporter ATP-binding protein n=1 Tax=Allocoprobacillus halotolerans TaxID=2944914 RepID=A0ABY5I547_9FIRM|nr:ABC transporter ATP-binding protein [Allocoprobacillus halotolerans]UTY40090.1 ABC transporter ATP-binding protein [Allocoprobacillus halotolerans]